MRVSVSIMHPAPPSGPLTLQLAHTTDLDPSALVSARGLLDLVFDDMTDGDWEHALGGVHALVWRDETLVGHGSVIQRRLLHAGRALRTGYVEAVAVHPVWRRQGVGGMVMGALERVIDRSYDLGALGATEEGAVFYDRRGWLRWCGPTSALTPDGIVRTPEEDDGVFIWPGQPGRVVLDRSGALTCDWRDGDVW